MKEVHTEQYLQLGLKISYYRKLKKLTQEQLAAYGGDEWSPGRSPVAAERPSGRYS